MRVLTFLLVAVSNIHINVLHVKGTRLTQNWFISAHAINHDHRNVSRFFKIYNRILTETSLSSLSLKFGSAIISICVLLSHIVLITAAAPIEDLSRINQP